MEETIVHRRAVPGDRRQALPAATGRTWASALYRRALIQENKWRAARYGIDGKLIDFGKQQEVPMRELVLELLEFVDDVVDELGSREAVDYVHTILERRHRRRPPAPGLTARPAI